MGAIQTLLDGLMNFGGDETIKFAKDKPTTVTYGHGPIGKAVDYFASLFPQKQQPIQSPSPSPRTIDQVKGQAIQNTPELQPNIQAMAQPGFRLPGVPNDIAQVLGSELDRYGLATEAARVLTHPREQTYTPQEIQKYGHDNWNGGENPQFKTVGSPQEDLQANGTFDRGLFRNNTGTFKLLQGSHKWNTILKNNGITDESQLNDPTISARYAKILGDWYEQDLNSPRWQGWFAAPLDLRTRQP